MLNELLFVIWTAFLVQVESVGGPPLVSPIRVKVGGSPRNEEEEERDTLLTVMLSCPACRNTNRDFYVQDKPGQSMRLIINVMYPQGN